MLYTNLKHIDSERGFWDTLNHKGASMVVCGRMDEASINFYRLAEKLERSLREIAFYDLEIDNPAIASLMFNNESAPFVPIGLLFVDGKLIRTFPLPSDERLFKNELRTLLQQNIQQPN